MSTLRPGRNALLAWFFLVVILLIILHSGASSGQIGASGHDAKQGAADLDPSTGKQSAFGWWSSYSTVKQPSVKGTISLDSIVKAAKEQLGSRVAQYDVARGEREMGLKLGDISQEGYEADLRRAWTTFFVPPDSPKAFSDTLDHIVAQASVLPLPADHPTRQPVPRHIYTTDISPPQTFPEQFGSWRSVNEPHGWDVRYVSDDHIDAWLETVLPGTPLLTEMKALRDHHETGVVRADLFRYLVLLLNGGVYTDTDTACVLPIDSWGQHASIRSSAPLIAALPDILALATSAGSSTARLPESSNLSDDDGPSIVIALESDSRDPGVWRDASFVRGIQVVQWTLLAKRAHPIMLDVVGRALHAARARRQAGPKEPEQTAEQKDSSVLEWTGPGPFTDAVLRYLLVRHGVSPYDLADMSQPLRIGDVLIMPLHSFRADASEGYQGDDKVVWHGFLGRWKGH